jgi:hypothetical protein
MSTGIEPHPRGIEGWAIADFQGKHLRIELAQAIQVPGANVEMIDAIDAHSSCQGRPANSMIM